MEEYIWEQTENNEDRVQALINEAGVTRPIALVLDMRGIGPEKNSGLPQSVHLGHRGPLSTAWNEGSLRQTLAGHPQRTEDSHPWRL